MITAALGGHENVVHEKQRMTEAGPPLALSGGGTAPSPQQVPLQKVLGTDYALWGYSCLKQNCGIYPCPNTEVIVQIHS